MSSNQCAINMDNNEDQNQLQQVTRQTQAMAIYDNTVLELLIELIILYTDVTNLTPKCIFYNILLLRLSLSMQSILNWGIPEIKLEFSKQFTYKLLFPK